MASETRYGSPPSFYAFQLQRKSTESDTRDILKRKKSLAIQWGAIGDAGVIQDTVGPDAVIGGAIPQRINSCLTVLDKFLQQKKPVVSSFVPYEPSKTTTQKASNHSVLSIVGKMFGIKDMSAINPETSLGDLGMDSLLSVEIKQFLERNFNLVLAVSELRKLKIKDLKKLEGAGEETKTTTTPESRTKPTSESNAKVAEKIPGHFGYLLSKQLVPAKTIIQMNSVKTGIPLFIVHPIEGTVAMLNSLAQLINLPVYGVQCTPEAPSESLEQLAAFYWKHIKTLNISNTIWLAGYSFGGAVAFEMCLQAERDPPQHAEVRNLILLDGSPALVTAYTREHKSYFRSDSIAEEELHTLCLYVLQFVDINVMEFKKELVSLPSLAARIKYSVEKISATYNNLQSEDLTLAFDLYYKKVLMSLKYMPRHKLKKEVTLIKASDTVDVTKNISETYDLEKVCDGKITVHTVKGTHDTFILEKGEQEISNLLSDIFSH